MPDTDRRLIAQTRLAPFQPGDTTVIHHEEISDAVCTYLARYPADTDRITALTTALEHAGDLTSRKTFPGHVTCSAIIIDAQGRVLHIRHNQLGTWLRPGGHLENSDDSLIAGVLREVTEETGISPGQLALVDTVPVDIDVHDIPARPAKGEPAHQHFDLRYLFTATSDNLPVELQTEEVHGVAWLPIADLRPSTLRERVAIRQTLG